MIKKTQVIDLQETTGVLDVFYLKKAGPTQKVTQWLEMFGVWQGFSPPDAKKIQLTPKCVQLALNGIQFTEKGVQFAPNGIQFAVKGVQLAPNGIQFATKGVQLTEKGVQLALNGIQLTEKSVQLAPNGIPFSF